MTSPKITAPPSIFLATPVYGGQASVQFWRDLDGEVWADFRTRLGHIAPAVFTGSFADAVAT